MVSSSRVIEATSPINKVTKVRWKIVFLICVASFIAYILRTNLSIVGETMMRELHLTEIQLGYIFSAFAWGYALFQFPGGVFGDVVGSRKAITLMAVGWGILTLFTGLVPATLSLGVLLTTLIVIRFLVGASQAPFFPVVGGVIANWFPVSGWGFPNGLTSTAATLGAAAVAPILVWLLQLTGWRQTFLLTAPLAFVIAVIWWWYGRDYPSMHRAVSQAELELINKNREAPSEHIAKNIWKIALANREVLLITFSYFCTNYVFYLFFNWFFFI